MVFLICLVEVDRSAKGLCKLTGHSQVDSHLELLQCRTSEKGNDGRGETLVRDTNLTETVIQIFPNTGLFGTDRNS